MKKVYLIIWSMVVALISYAQTAEKANFTLLESGEFVVADTDNSKYIVIPFENKSAEELYKTLMANAALAVDNPDEQVSGVEYSVVKVNVTSHLLNDVIMMIPFSCTGTIYFEFQIKDGRVRVNAPYVTDLCHYGVSDKICYFTQVVKGYFKKGKLKEKKASEFNSFINKTNLFIDSILGIKPDATDDMDW